MTPDDELPTLIPSTRHQRGQPTYKYSSIDRMIADALDIDHQSVYTATSSKPGNISVRVTQSNRANRARYIILVAEDAHDEAIVTSTVNKVAAFVGPGGKRAAVVIGERTPSGNDWTVKAVVEQAGGPVLAALRAHWPTVIRHDPAMRRAVGPGTAFTVPLSMDDRTARMARLAVATSPAVLFVGPPGTGKNRLLNEIIDEVRSDPSGYGFTTARDVAIEPADEGWTTRDLVGGETIDEARQVLRFRPGKVLDAIANDRWLVIDEANRADLDRIFGGLLTWLSMQQVVVGRASTAVDAPLVRLGWTNNPSSDTIGTDRLTADTVGSEPIDYLAGTEFRLLGTYNALDAHRVFRFGLALGRRFAQVPVPPASVTAFTTMVETSAASIEDEEVRRYVSGRVVSLYRAHYESTGARLGPAMFLTIPEYVSKGLELADLVDIAAGSDQDLDHLIAEAYLLSTGSWLARLDAHSELPDLATKLTHHQVNDDESVSTAALSQQGWEWISSQLPTIGG